MCNELITGLFDVHLIQVLAGPSENTVFVQLIVDTLNTVLQHIAKIGIGVQVSNDLHGTGNAAGIRRNRKHIAIQILFRCLRILGNHRIILGTVLCSVVTVLIVLRQHRGITLHKCNSAGLTIRSTAEIAFVLILHHRKEDIIAIICAGKQAVKRQAHAAACALICAAVHSSHNGKRNIIIDLVGIIVYIVLFQRLWRIIPLLLLIVGLALILSIQSVLCRLNCRIGQRFIQPDLFIVHIPVPNEHPHAFLKGCVNRKDLVGIGKRFVLLCEVGKIVFAIQNVLDIRDVIIIPIKQLLIDQHIVILTDCHIVRDCIGVTIHLNTGKQRAGNVVLQLSGGAGQLLVQILNPLLFDVILISIVTAQINDINLVLQNIRILEFGKTVLVDHGFLCGILRRFLRLVVILQELRVIREVHHKLLLDGGGDFIVLCFIVSDRYQRLLLHLLQCKCSFGRKNLLILIGLDCSFKLVIILICRIEQKIHIGFEFGLRDFRESSFHRIISFLNGDCFLILLTLRVVIALVLQICCQLLVRIANLTLGLYPHRQCRCIIGCLINDVICHFAVRFGVCATGQKRREQHQSAKNQTHESCFHRYVSSLCPHTAHVGQRTLTIHSYFTINPCACQAKFCKRLFTKSTQ